MALSQAVSLLLQVEKANGAQKGMFYDTDVSADGRRQRAKPQLVRRLIINIEEGGRADEAS